jgi:hypothetical protein
MSLGRRCGGRVWAGQHVGSKPPAKRALHGAVASERLAVGFAGRVRAILRDAPALDKAQQRREYRLRNCRFKISNKKNETRK